MYGGGVGGGGGGECREVPEKRVPPVLPHVVWSGASTPTAVFRRMAPAGDLTQRWADAR